MKRSREPEEEGPPSGALPALVATDDGPQPPDKIRELDPAAQDADCAPVATCSMPPHRDAIGFASYQDYETHHLQVHTNRCLECRKNFPSGHLLSIHIEEWHDPLVQLRRDRGEHTVRVPLAQAPARPLTSRSIRALSRAASENA